MEQQLFSAADLERISAAVRQAESKTSGEIVPYFVERSDDYEAALWRGGALLGSLAVFVLAAIHLFSDRWHGFGLFEVVLIVAGACGAGMTLVYAIPKLRRLCAGNSLLEQRVAQRAAQAFIAEEVFKTRDRTGILLFLSHLEHKVLVVGDSGINEKVDQSEWENVAAAMVRGINNGRPANGLVEAIELCGTLLQKHGVKRRKRDANELANRLRAASRKSTNRRRK
jgi:putative membrane protein